MLCCYHLCHTHSTSGLPRGSILLNTGREISAMWRTTQIFRPFHHYQDLSQHFRYPGGFPARQDSLPVSVTNGAFPKAGAQADAALGAHAVAAAIAHGAPVHQQPQGLLAASTRPLPVLMPCAFCPLPPKLLQLLFHFPNPTGKNEKEKKKKITEDKILTESTSW